ncbi:MAG: CHASE domain-containing protein, partial [Phycisphaerales bacterium]|nr:CHASE domain-containing protein [Phycisphaerales bacterium]
MSSMGPIDDRREQGRTRIFPRVSLPLLVLLSTVSGTFLFWSGANEYATANARRQLEHRVLECADDLRARFSDCEKTLNMGRVLIRCSEHVTRDEWRQFVESIGLCTALPGVNGIAYVRVVAAEELPGYIEEARTNIDPGFRRRVRTGGDETGTPRRHYLIHYHEPEWRNGELWGLDVATHQENRVAYDSSMDSGEMRMTEAISLEQEGECGEPMRGLVLAVPVYEGEETPPTPELRRERIRGWVSISIDVEEFLSHWWSQSGMEAGYILSERDRSGAARLLHRRAGPNGAQTGPSTLALPLTVAGRRWELDVFLTAPLGVDEGTANITLVVGLTISLLVSGIMWSLTHTKHRAVQLAERMTAHLRKSEERQRRLAGDARQANRMKSIFLANMSHDVRTPMTAILGYTRLLEEELGERMTPLTGEAMTAIRRSGDHLLGLINNVLDLAKIEAGRIELISDPIDTAELILGCVEIVRPTADAKRIALRVELRTPIPARISGDSTRIQQIVINLLGNAVKFTERGSVSWSIWADERDSGLLCFEFLDTGIGMSDADLRRVFEP